MYASLRIFSDLADDGNSLKISLCFLEIFFTFTFFLCIKFRLDFFLEL